MSIFDKISNIISDISGIDTITIESQLQVDLSLDSLQMVTLLIMIEETFGITLEESDLNPFVLLTISDVVNLTQKYVGDNYEEDS